MNPAVCGAINNEFENTGSWSLDQEPSQLEMPDEH